MGKFRDLAGERFGRIFVVRRFLEISGGAGTRQRVKWICVCDCGQEKVIPSKYLASGGVVSCGCQRIERTGKQNLQHGNARVKTRTATYKAWCGMRHRCTNPRSSMWENYGGRGIGVCERWADFKLFLADMGECPAGHSIERKNVNGDYEPDNCCWIPNGEQAKNKTTTRYVMLNGERMIATDAARRLGVMKQTLNKWRTGVNRIPPGLDISFELTAFSDSVLQAVTA